MGTATKHRPRMRSHRGMRREWRAVAGGRSINMSVVLQFCCLLFTAVVPGGGQTWDAGPGKLKVGVEERFRYEFRGGNGFGRDVDTAVGLARTRVSLTYESPVVKLSGMFQDARAPWYGLPAPNNLRDTADLQEAYFELFPKRKTGFGLLAGRIMLNYGEGRLLGSPQWGNTARTFDHAHVWFGTGHARFEVLMASPVKVRTDAFNRPELGERVWGLYNTFSDFGPHLGADVYLLRHEQNRPGGFTTGSRATGTDRLGVNVLGFRLTGPLAAGWKFSMEGVAENGWLGPARQRAGAWFSGASRRWTVGARPLDLSVEYKYASPTFDQI